MRFYPNPQDRTTYGGQALHPFPRTRLLLTTPHPLPCLLPRPFTSLALSFLLAPCSTLLTTTRCIVHTDQTLPKDYKSTMSIDIQNPQQHKDFALQVKRDVGPRRLRMEQAIRAQVEAEFTQKNATEYTESRQVDYSTETKRALSATVPGFVPYLDR